jgi:hypothetical protein
MGQAWCTHRVADQDEGTIWNLEHPGITRRVLLEWIVKKRRERVDWFQVGRGKVRWRALVNTIMKFSVP